MKFIFAVILLYGLNASAARRGDEMAEGGPTATDRTEADATVVRACSGSCDTQTRTINYNEKGPEEVNKEWQKIVPGTMTPEQLQQLRKSSATKEQGA